MTANVTRTKRYQALDMWRGAICLFVVLEHAAVALWQGSSTSDGGSRLREILVAPFQTNWGTPLFFVISGFCIASSVESCRRRGTPPALFLARRFWRVFPAYWVALLGFGAMVFALDQAGLSRLYRNPYALELSSIKDLTREQWIGNITLTETWRPHVAGGEVNVFTRVAWSLCFQEQFYLICFAALLFRRKPLAWTLAIATVVIVAFRIVAEDVGRLPLLSGTFPMLWHQFAMGLAVYWYLNGQVSLAWRRVILCVLALSTLMLPFIREAMSTAVASGFSLAMIGFHRFDDRWARIRSLNPLRAIGRCSYSVYLAHLPVIVITSGLLAECGLSGFWARAAVTVPVASAASIVVGLAFYRWVESRFLEIPSYIHQPKPAVAAPATIHCPSATNRPDMIAARASA